MPLTVPPTSSSVLDMVPLNEHDEQALSEAARDVADSKRQYDEARKRREEVIRTAALSGASYREIAALSGVSYQRVAQLLTGELPWARPGESTILARCPKCGAAPGVLCEKKKGNFHLERDHRMAGLMEGEIPPDDNEPGPLTPFYVQMMLALGRFPQARGWPSISREAIEAALEPGRFVGVWTGRKWEPVDA